MTIRPIRGEHGVLHEIITKEGLLTLLGLGYSIALVGLAYSIALIVLGYSMALR